MLIFALVVRFALDRSRGVNAQLDQLRMEAAAESALHDQLFSMLAPGQRASADVGREPPVFRNAVSTGPSDGLVDLNQANEQLLVRLFKDQYGSDAQAAYERLRLRRPVTSYADLVAATGSTESELACLLQRATLFSNRGTPALEAAPAAVKVLLNGPFASAPASGLVTAVDTAYARPWWIQIEVEGPHRARRRLRSEVIVTNRADRPFGVLDRRWLDASVSLDRCS